MDASRRDILLLSALTAAALALRLPRLESVPPGLLVDEAYQGLQGVAIWSGEKLPDIPEQGHAPSCPLWATLVAVSTRILGVTVAAARTPAAVVGALSVPLVWVVADALLGRAAAWTAAVFLCGSFWHVQYSRQCWPWVTLVAEGLAVAWLLLSARARSRAFRAASAGLIAGLACYEYPAAFALVLWGAAVVAVRPFTEPGERRTLAVAAAAFALGLATGLAPMALGLQGRSQIGRTLQISSTHGRSSVAGRLVPYANLFVRVPAAQRQWTSFPPGAARLSVVERIVVAAGIVALAAAGGVAGFVRAATAGWLFLMLLPEAVPGELHLSRGIGALAPLALLAGLGGRLAAGTWGRTGLAAVLAAMVLNAGWTARLVYAAWPADPGVRVAFQYTGCEATRFVRDRAREAAIRLPESNISYENAPAGRFLLWREISSGRIVPMDNVETARAGFKPTTDFWRHPVTNEPYSFVLGTNRYPADRRYCLVNIHQLLETGRMHEEAGRLMDAEAYYRYVLSLFPDSVWTRATLARLLWREGRRQEAARLGLQPTPADP